MSSSAARTIAGVGHLVDLTPDVTVRRGDRAQDTARDRTAHPGSTRARCSAACRRCRRAAADRSPPSACRRKRPVRPRSRKCSTIGDRGSEIGIAGSGSGTSEGPIVVGPALSNARRSALDRSGSAALAACGSFGACSSCSSFGSSCAAPLICCGIMSSTSDGTANESLTVLPVPDSCSELISAIAFGSFVILPSARSPWTTWRRLSADASSLVRRGASR